MRNSLLFLLLLAACHTQQTPTTSTPKPVYDGTPIAMGTPPFTFPDGFLFGSAIAQYQAEGTWIPGDTTASSNFERWEFLGKCNGERSGKAADFREQWSADLDRMQAMGLTAFRFSIDWARIEPQKGQFSQSEMNHVLEVLKGARDRHITVFLTFFHWTVPLDVQNPEGCAGHSCPSDLIGVYSPEFADRFAAYVAWVVPQVKDLVDLYPVINEPFSVMVGGYLAGFLPPGFALDFEGFRASFANLAFAHAKAAKVIRALDDVDADGDGVKVSIGTAMASAQFYAFDPASSDDAAAADRLNYVANDAWLDALTTGNLDIDMDRKYTTATTHPPEGAYPELKGSLDWIGVNFYGPGRAQAAFGVLENIDALPKLDVTEYDGKLPHNDLNTEIKVEAFLTVLGHYADRWKLPLYITENGTADATDVLRPRYLVEHLAAVASAIARGVDIRGYLHWSILDNFEWHHGSVPRFGLFRVEYQKPGFPRLKTTSAGIYGDIVGQHAISAELFQKWTSQKYVTDGR